MTITSTAAPTRAVLFDLDGTLYDPRPLRLKMLLELARAPLSGPLRALRTVRRLKTFREAREGLRELGDTAPSLEEAQYEVPAERLGDDPDALRETVVEWMHRRPLKYLGGAGWPELRSTLEALRARGLVLGVFSDYPPGDKLAALGVADLFDVAIAATDPAVNAFKPHPRGFLVAVERLGVSVDEAVYVGDRVDVDALGAAGAGLRCVILGGSAPEPGAGHAVVGTFADLPDTLAR